MTKDIAISVKNLDKEFILPHEKSNSLKKQVLSLGKNRNFEKLKVLHDISFEVERGEFFGIVGKNGSGKSTLLKILGGIYQPSRGSTILNGTLTPFIELGIGFNAELTGRENVYLNGAILGLTKNEIENKYEEIVAFAELEKFMDQKLKNYSSGMQVRLAFSIAIQAHNDILLIDEVLAVGDATFQRKCFNFFKQLKRSGKTVVFVTHDMGAVQEFCDRALMIQDGRIAVIGEPRVVALNYEIANAGFGSSNQLSKMERPENSEVRLKQISTRNQNKTKNRFTLGDNIIVDVTFEVSQPEELQFNIYFVRSDGVYVAGINTTEDLPKFNPKKGIHTISCLVEAGQLPKAEYHVNVAAYKGGIDAPVLVDIMDEGYGVKTPQISVIEKSLTQNGEFYIKAQWRRAEH